MTSLREIAGDGTENDHQAVSAKAGDNIRSMMVLYTSRMGQRLGIGYLYNKAVTT